MTDRLYGYLTTVCLLIAVAAALVSDYLVDWDQWALRGIALIAALASLGFYLFKHKGPKKT